MGNLSSALQFFLLLPQKKDLGRNTLHKSYVKQNFAHFLRNNILSLLSASYLNWLPKSHVVFLISSLKI